MNYKKEDFEEILWFLSNLRQGVDPFSRIKVEDTILDNSQNKKMIDKTIELIESLEIYAKKPDRRKKSNFCLTKDQKANVVISEKPISISAFVYSINAVIDSENMKKIRAMQITNWLLEKGFLTQNTSAETHNKIVTPAAAEVGISMVKKADEDGMDYTVCLYDKTAQDFVLDHINEIVEQF